MQPKSIKRFDLFYLASLAVSTAAFFLGYDDTVRELRTQTAGAGMEVGGGLTTSIFIVGMAVSLLLWWLISVKRSAVAKWILVVLCALSLILIGVPQVLANLTLTTILELISLVLSLAAAWFLFQPDTKPWFDKEGRR